jgi:DNA polymerase I
MTGPFAVLAEGPIALAIDRATGAALVDSRGGSMVLSPRDAIDTIAEIESDIGARWVWWSKDTARALVEAGIRPARCWDLDAVHRLLMGGWKGGAQRVWAVSHGLDPSSAPTTTPVDLFSALDDNGDPDEPVLADGHLRPEWVDGQWGTSARHLADWARLAGEVQRLQAARLDALAEHPGAAATARSESAAELLGVELEHDGLPVDVEEAERIIASFIGRRPRDDAEELALTAERDRLVLQHLPAGHETDLRNPAHVKSMLRRVGIEVADTRAWRLERHRGDHPVVEAFLTWRKAERIATTFGYRWLDEHVADDRRLRGSWSASDGAAGRMTATAGLHNLPADLRPAVAAEPGCLFVRADLGQIEPRILAAVSGDQALAVATHDDDMYAPVAHRLGVDREIAKVAVLGAMYGQTTGHGASALRGLQSAYPVAMAYLRRADEAAQSGRELRTIGGRRIATASTSDPAGGEPGGPDAAAARAARSRAAARGRFGRNAMVQGAAAEFFKTWAVIVRARASPLGARVVLCLHDELLVHVASERADEVAALVGDCLAEAAHRWAPVQTGRVRFVADTLVVRRWSDAK